MPGVIDADETEIAMLADGAYLGTVQEERCITCSTEVADLGVRNLQADSFVAQPVANIISVAGVEGDTNTTVEQVGEIWNGRWKLVVASPLEGSGDSYVGHCPVERNSRLVLDLSLVQKSFERLNRGHIGAPVGPDVIGATVSKIIIEVYQILQ